MRSDDRTLRQLAQRVLGPNKVSTPSVAACPQNNPSRILSAPWYARDEKQTLKEFYDTEVGFVHGPQLQHPSTVSRRGTRTYFSLALVSAVGLSLFYLLARSPHFGPCGSTIRLAQDDGCPQTTGITPQSNNALLAELEANYLTDDFKLKAFESLGGAVRIPYVF